MQGLIFVVERLGQALAQAEHDNNVLKQRVELLEATLAEKNGEPVEGAAKSK